MGELLNLFWYVAGFVVARFAWSLLRAGMWRRKGWG